MRIRLGTVAIVVSLLGVVPGRSAAGEGIYTYATMSDGVRIALAVSFPPGYDPADPGAHIYPAILGMTGYAASVDLPGASNKYVQINASHRGTGCSGGQFDPFSDRVAQDGYEIIENWIVHQPWSNGDVGVSGGSWGGLNAILIASTAPPHLRVVTASGLTDDLYRDIAFPGGIPNRGFPLLWGAERELPLSEQEAANTRIQTELAAGDPACAANIASRLPHVPFIAQFAAHPFDDSYWAGYSLYTRAAKITAPTWIGHTWQDSGTGPSGVYVWERIPDGVPKRLTLSNGDHGSSSVDPSDRQAWTDCWLVRHGSECGDTTDASRRVRVYFETTGPKEDRTLNSPLVAPDFPLPSAEWNRLFFRQGGDLSATPPTSQESSSSYQASPTAATSAAFTRSFDAPTTIAGPMAATVWISTQAPDADVYVAIADVDGDGDVQYLQRGMLRASHRALDTSRSMALPSGPHAGELYRPYHLDTAASSQPIVPAEPTRLDIQLWPVAHLFRAGHRMVVEVRAVPVTDFVGGTYEYVTPVEAPPVNVLHDAAHPSSILVPMFAATPPVSDQPPACGNQTGITCLAYDPPPAPGRMDAGAVVADGEVKYTSANAMVVAAHIVGGAGTMVFRGPALAASGGVEIAAVQITSFIIEGSTATVQGVCYDANTQSSATCTAVFEDGSPDTVRLHFRGATYSGPMLTQGQVVVISPS